MRNNETGEFELIVGNRQLLSGFFIVVLLFAVAFAMGYVVGQNSPRSTKVMAEMPATTPVSAADGRPSASAAAVAPPQQPAPAPADTPAPVPSPAAEAPPQPAAQPPAQSAPAESTTSGGELPPGSYWQVIAVAEPEAAVIYKTLKDRGFPTLMSPGPKNLMRVLVGPYNDTQSMGKAKTELENAGFHPFRK
jgi:cell division septation protein DedD